MKIEDFTKNSCLNQKIVLLKRNFQRRLQGFPCGKAKQGQKDFKHSHRGQSFHKNKEAGSDINIFRSIGEHILEFHQIMVHDDVVKSVTTS
mgnify:CR=1 FL=1